MIQRIKFLAIAAIAAVLVACGGGGDDSTPNFAGTYAITVSVTSNTCGGNLSGITGADVVTQDGRNISIVSGAYTFTGSVDADNNGFSVSTSTVSNGVTVNSTVTFRNTATGGTYTVVQKVGSSVCEVVYTGTATKI
ncbi:MAG TPA: hypothetical protein PK702_05670 [Burkholderiaceae bacterium]|nr:hypothetical protein [Burkholderiaceae bacterium]